MLHVQLVKWEDIWKDIQKGVKEKEKVPNQKIHVIRENQHQVSHPVNHPGVKHPRVNQLGRKYYILLPTIYQLALR